jgi:hypothetical protein
LKILLDEGAPKSLLLFLSDLNAVSTQSQGWAGFKNGNLLTAATSAGFDIFVTLDTNLQYQQNLNRYNIKIIVIRAKTNQLKDLQPLFGKIREALISGFSEKLLIIS